MSADLRIGHQVTGFIAHHNARVLLGRVIKQHGAAHRNLRRQSDPLLLILRCFGEMRNSGDNKICPGNQQRAKAKKFHHLPAGNVVVILPLDGKIFTPAGRLFSVTAFTFLALLVRHLNLPSANWPRRTHRYSCRSTAPLSHPLAPDAEAPEHSLLSLQSLLRSAIRGWLFPGACARSAHAWQRSELRKDTRSRTLDACRCWCGRNTCRTSSSG